MVPLCNEINLISLKLRVFSVSTTKALLARRETVLFSYFLPHNGFRYQKEQHSSCFSWRVRNSRCGDGGWKVLCVCVCVGGGG